MYTCPFYFYLQQYSCIFLHLVRCNIFFFNFFFLQSLLGNYPGGCVICSSFRFSLFIDQRVSSYPPNVHPCLFLLCTSVCLSCLSIFITQTSFETKQDPEMEGELNANEKRQLKVSAKVKSWWILLNLLNKETKRHFYSWWDVMSPGFSWHIPKFLSFLPLSKWSLAENYFSLFAQCVLNVIV